jgi:hypothetical protein
MILPSGKVGYRRLYDQPRVNARGCSILGSPVYQGPAQCCLPTSVGDLGTELIHVFKLVTSTLNWDMVDSCDSGDSV